MSDTERFNVRWDVVMTVVAWLVGGVLAYGALDGRIKVLEVQYQMQSEMLRDIRSDVKHLVEIEGAKP